MAHVGFEVLMAVTMQVAALCTLERVQCFREIYIPPFTK
jgi:hypothetical protein